MLLACLLPKSSYLSFIKCLTFSKASFFLSIISFFFCRNLLSSEASLILFSYKFSGLLLLLGGLGLRLPFLASRLLGLDTRCALA